MSTELSIIVPTFNERENIQPFVNAIKNVLKNINWELIFVDDDSPDGTSSLVRELANNDNRIRCIQRIRRRGLSSACVEGILASSSKYLCIMDADMQHDESLIPKIYLLLLNENLDMVIASRYISHGSTGTLPGLRRIISLVATKISQKVLKVNVTDPMSGFFMVNREFFEKIKYRISGRGFKILLDFIVSSREPVKFKELPYTMRSRTRGDSKLNFLVVWDFFILVLNRFLGEILPYRFISFMTVAFSGLILHLLILWIMYDISNLNFTLSQSVATFIAMTTNYIFNNIFTYHDNKKSGNYFWRGLLSFYLVCMLGAIVNVALATELFQRSVPWILSGIFGALAGAIWNFTVSSIFVWGRARPTAK
ncbi:MAG: glycosyltransferase [Gammaproteobacteria bacterium]|jgi:dolichol-phosphate mannosyltransferase